MPQPALVDTGTSLIAAPVDAMINLLRYLKDKTGSLYTCMSGSIYCVYCSGIDKNERLEFVFGGTRLGIDFGDLFLDLGGMCGLLVSPIQSQMWILGDVFIRNYYVVIKYDEGVIDLYPNNNNLVSNNLVMEGEGSPLVKILVGLGIFIIVVAFLVVAIKMCKSTKRLEAPEQSESLLETYNI